MQNSNLSSKIFPIIKDEWSHFIKLVEKDLSQMMVIYNNDKRRLKDLERLINKIKEISNLSKDNIVDILNYKELFMYIDNSLESSFDALIFFKEKGDFNNIAVKNIYERIVNSPKIIKMNSEYNSFLIKTRFDSDRIKSLSELIHGSKIDYVLIKELLAKYRLSNDKKKNILFYPVVMLSIKQKDIKNNKETVENKKREKQEFYRNSFNELVKLYQKKKEEYKELLIRCFNVRENMKPSDVDMYGSFANNPDESITYNFDDETKFKIYTLAFFKIKKDIENYIDGINDMTMEYGDLDDEIVFFNEMIGEFDNVARMLNSLISNDKEADTIINSNIYFALDIFNQIYIKELLNEKTISNIRALLQKADNISNSKIEGVKTNHMLGVSEEEKILGKNISMITTSKLKLAYVMVNKNILIIGGCDTNDRIDQVVRYIVGKNPSIIKKQIELIEQEDLNYIEIQNEIISDILEEKTKVL